MSWSINVGSIAGTAIRIHMTFLLFLIWIFAAGWSEGGANAAWTSLIFMVLLFACVLAHEFGHIFMARAFGVPHLNTGRRRSCALTSSPARSPRWVTMRARL